MAPREILEISDDDEPLHASSPGRVPDQRPIKPLPSRVIDIGDREQGQNPGSSSYLPPNRAIPLPEPTRDLLASRALEVVPDVDIQYLMKAIDALLVNRVDSPLEQILHTLLEKPDYPRQQPKKRKLSQDNSTEPTLKTRRIDIDYMDIRRPYEASHMYKELTMDQLMVDFPFVSKASVRKCLVESNGFYAPAHFRLLAEQTKPTGHVKLKTVKSRVPAKSRVADPAFLAEREWLESRLREAAEQRDQATAESIDEEENGGIDCGCCFTHKMIQCEEGHLFCRDCMLQYCETLLGAQNHEIKCMDQSACKGLFPQSELTRFLTPKLMELFLRIKQRKEIAAAGLHGLEECPFCDFKMVIENEQEKLFRCQNDECLAVSCRQCKKPDHLPKSCQEMEVDRKLDGKHAIEEALSKALMRNCPKCQKAFIKEDGCNKMTCPECRTLSCYICRQVISDYNHFDQTPRHLNGGVPSTSKIKGKCSLWDISEVNKELEIAARDARDRVKATNPDIEESDLSVEVPQIPGQRAVGQIDPRGVVGPLGAPNNHLPAFPFNPHLPQLPQMVVVDAQPLALLQFGGPLNGARGGRPGRRGQDHVRRQRR